MTPRIMLQTIANTAGKAAEIYPSMISLMDRAGIPFSDRMMVLEYIIIALAGDSDPEPIGGKLQ